MDKMLLIDGNSLINRAFFALPPLNNKDGKPTQAVFGFTTMLIKAINDIKPKFIAVAFDLPKPTFRHLKYDGYKSSRKKMPEELAVQMPILKDLLSIMNIKFVELAGFEADDIIGTLSKKTNVFTYILTGDRDSLQLIDDNTTVILTKRGITDTIYFDESTLMQEYSLTPKQVIEYKALAGDSSDDIPGVAGVGDKTAKNLLHEYSDLNNIYAHIDEIKGTLKNKLIDNKDMAYLSQELATINVNVAIDTDATHYAYDYPFNNEVRRFFIDNNFKSLLKRDDIFNIDEKEYENIKADIVEISDINNLKELISTDKDISIYLDTNLHFAFDDNTEYIVKIAQNLVDVGLDLSLVIKTFGEILANKNIKKYVYDAKSIKKFLDKRYNIQLNNFEDVKLAQFLVDMTVDFENLSSLLEINNISSECFACGQLIIYNRLINELRQNNMLHLYKDIELPLVNTLFNMEKTGVKVDVDLLNSLGEKYTSILDELVAKITEQAGYQVNINSPKQLSSLLFEKLLIPYPGKTKKHSTSAEILEMIDSEEYPIINDILHYRAISKLNSTYIDGLRKLLDNNNEVHTEYKQMLTTTGRLSSVEPNLQNIPVRTDEGKELRGLFIARPNCTLISADYSQIELRLLAHFSQDEKMLKLYNEQADIHTITASEVFGVDPDKVTKQMRRDAKAVNFGIVYGISEYGLSKNLKIGVGTARRYIKRYFERFASIKDYLNSSIEKAKKDGFATTLLGRQRKIPELLSPNYNVRQFGERVAMNTPLQGSAADIIKIAMVNVNKQLENKKSKLILQIHDELIIEADNSELEEVTEILRNCMENAVSLTVPLIVDINSGKSWLDC